MSKHHYNVSKKDCVSIYDFMKNYMGVSDKPWNKMHHKELKTFAEVKGYDMPHNAPYATFKRNSSILVRDASGSIACYQNPKPFIPGLLLRELQSTPIEEIERRRQKILEELAGEEENVQIQKRMIKERRK